MRVKLNRTIGMKENKSTIDEFDFLVAASPNL
jgi:hypothetical protein